MAHRGGEETLDAQQHSPPSLPYALWEEQDATFEEDFDAECETMTNLRESCNLCS